MFGAYLFYLRKPIKAFKNYQKHSKSNSTVYFDTISKSYNLLHDIEKQRMYNIYIHIYQQKIKYPYAYKNNKEK